jgi:hypothetical protein
VCRAAIGNDLLPGELWCPSCGVLLRTRRSYFRALFVIALCLSVIGLRLVGVDNRYWLVGTLIVAFPVFLVVAAFNARLFPVELDISENAASATHRSATARRPVTAMLLRAGALVLVMFTAYMLLRG